MDITNTLKAIILLDVEGKRFVANFYDEKLNTKQFERKLFVKTKMNRTRDEILVIDGLLVVHKFLLDYHLYVISNRSENPMVLDSVMSCVADVLSSLMSKNTERHSIRNRLAHIIIALDEISDNGLILEMDSNLILQRVLLKDDVAEQSMAQKIQSATEHIRFPWLRS